MNIKTIQLPIENESHQFYSEDNEAGLDIEKLMETPGIYSLTIDGFDARLNVCVGSDSDNSIAFITELFGSDKEHLNIANAIIQNGSEHGVIHAFTILSMGIDILRGWKDVPNKYFTNKFEHDSGISILINEKSINIVTDNGLIVTADIALYAKKDAGSTVETRDGSYFVGNEINYYCPAIFDGGHYNTWIPSEKLYKIMTTKEAALLDSIAKWIVSNNIKKLPARKMDYIIEELKSLPLAS